MLVVIGLGANLGRRLEALRAARAALTDFGQLHRASGVYETAPIGPPQPAFLNAALLLETPLTPSELLSRALEIERHRGRVRRERWGPRSLDLDLLWADLTHHSPELELPHPRLCERAFALRPLLDVLEPTGVAPPGVVAGFAAALQRVGMLGVQPVAVSAEWHRCAQA